MTSVRDIQTPFAKSASVDKKDASTEKAPVNNNQTSNPADNISTPRKMAPTAKPLASFNKKRSSTASSNDEGTGNESLNHIKRSRIEGEKGTPTPRGPTSCRQSASSRGLTRPEEHVFDIPGGAIIFGQNVDKRDVEGFSSAATPSKKLIDVKIPAQVVENKTAKLSSPAEASSSTPSTPTSDAEEDDEEEILSPPSISPARFTSLNETMRRIYNAKPEDTNSFVLCKDIAEIMKIKDYNFAVMSQRLAKLEKDAEENLSVADDSKSDLLENAKEETSRVKAELQNKLEESHEVTNKRKVKLDELCVDYKRNTTSQGDDLKGAVTAKKEAERSRLDSVAYERAATAEEKILRGDPADKRTIRHLQGQINELEGIHKDNVKAYEDLESKYDQKCQAHNDKCEELKEEIYGMEQKMESEFQRGCNIMENHYQKEHQHLRSKLRNYQLENQNLKSELEYYQVEHQNLQSELAQGRQWAKNIVNSCPYPVGQAIEAENARGDEVMQARNEAVQPSLDKLQEIEQERARILGEHNEYLQRRTLAAGSEDNGVSYIKTEPTEEGRHDDTYSATPPHQRQEPRAQSPEQNWYQDDDANHHFSSHIGDDSENDSASFPPAVPAAGLATAKLQTRKSRAQLREYQPVDSSSSQGIHHGFPSTQGPGDFRPIFKCPHNRGSRGNNCNHCGEQMFFEGDKEFDSKQPAATPQNEENFEDLPDYESDEAVYPPPEQQKRGARSYTDVEVQPYAAIPNSIVEDDTTSSPGDECSHPIMFGNTCGVCGEAMKDASKVSLQAAPVSKKKIAGTLANGSQPLSKKGACQHLHLDRYGVCEGCFKCQHLKVNDDSGSCKFCWKKVDPPVAAPGVAASLDSSPSPPLSKKRRNRPEVDSESKSDSKARSRPTKKVKTVTKNSLDSMFPTFPAFHPAKANPFSVLAATLSSANSKSSADSFFKPAHPGWKTPAILSSPVSPPAPAAPAAKQVPSAATTPPKYSQPNSGSPSLAPSNEETGGGSK